MPVHHVNGGLSNTHHVKRSTSESYGHMNGMSAMILQIKTSLSTNKLYVVDDNCLLTHKVSLSTKGFSIGVNWYPHWKNMIQIWIKVSPNQDSMVDSDPNDWQINH